MLSSIRPYLRKWRIITASLILAAATVMSLAVVTASTPAANADQLLNICTITSPAQCQNKWGSITAGGIPVNYYHYQAGNVNNRWAVNWKGYVNGSNCTNNCWPFDSGSGMNSRYNGRPVYQMVLGSNPSFCEDQGNYNVVSQAGDMWIQQCENINDQYFVYSAANYLIPVGATDAQWEYQHDPGQIPVFDGSNGNTGDGQAVVMNSVWYSTWQMIPG